MKDPSHKVEKTRGNLNNGYAWKYTNWTGQNKEKIGTVLWTVYWTIQKTWRDDIFLWIGMFWTRKGTENCRRRNWEIPITRSVHQNLHKNVPTYMKTKQWPTDWKLSIYFSVLEKKGHQRLQQLPDHHNFFSHK